ncbi:MAG TPA: hypothetical protein VGK88_06320 [bacterium]|jgi:Zn-dependent protease
MELLGWLVLVIVSALVHEGGHILAARAVGVAPIRVSLSVLGVIPVLRVHLGGLGTRPRAQQAAVICSGAGAQVVLAVVALAVARLLPGPVGAAALRLAQISLTLAVVNLLPLDPLDGYWLTAAVWGPTAALTLRWVSPVLRIALYVVCGLGAGAMLIRALGADAFVGHP